MVSKIDEWLKEHGITEVEAVIPDMSGMARGKFIPARKFSSTGMRLPESVFVQTVNGQFLDDFPDIDHDLDLRPDPDTLCVVPWALEPTALVIEDCFYANGEPVSMSPRQVLKRVIGLYEARGWKPVVAPEVEFYLVRQNIDPDLPLVPPTGRSGRPETARQPFSIDAVNEFDPIIEDIYDWCEAMDIGADSLTHEGGPAQLEINFLHGDPLHLADQVFLFKRVVREAALKHGLHATFMAKPMAEEPGSAMHLHQSVLSLESGENIFSNADGTESVLFHNFIAGFQKFLPEALLIFGPYANSYRRFTRYLSAPINVHWGVDNRTVGLRVPRSDPSQRRVENRVPGADVNPYLAIAASLACGYLGLVGELQATPPIEGSAYERQLSLSRDLFHAAERLQVCTELREVLGPEFVDIYCGLKITEHETYFQVISPWEREYLLLNV